MACLYKRHALTSNHLEKGLGLETPLRGEVDSVSNMIRLFLSDQFVNNLEPKFDSSASTTRSDDISIHNAFLSKNVRERLSN